MQVIKRMTEETSSGALLVNDCLVHFSVSSLPFGGVGECTVVHLCELRHSAQRPLTGKRFCWGGVRSAGLNVCRTDRS